MDSWFINMIRERCERVIKLARQRQSMADDDDECIAEPSRLLSLLDPLLPRLTSPPPTAHSTITIGVVSKNLQNSKQQFDESQFCVIRSRKSRAATGDACGQQKAGAWQHMTPNRANVE